jgi:D-tyrosyl-tRNA(Tyr) deacylase
MRALLQRVSAASVSVDNVITGQIGEGFLVFLGVGKSDTQEDLEYLVDKVINLRVFPDEHGKFDRSVQDVGGEILLVSQFTLYADTRKGRRPSFSDAMPVNEAKELFIEATEAFRNSGVNIETGVFQADMSVSLVNEGPVTLLIDSVDRLKPRNV